MKGGKEKEEIEGCVGRKEKGRKKKEEGGNIIKSMMLCRCTM